MGPRVGAGLYDKTAVVKLESRAWSLYEITCVRQHPDAGVRSERGAIAFEVGRDRLVAEKQIVAWARLQCDRLFTSETLDESIDQKECFSWPNFEQIIS